MVLAFVLGRVAAAADAQQQLSRAAQSGDVARVRALLADPATAPASMLEPRRVLCDLMESSFDPRDDSFLARPQHADTALALLSVEASAQVRTPCHGGRTVLYYAVLLMLPSLVRELLARGADPLAPMPSEESGSLFTMALRDSADAAPCCLALLRSEHLSAATVRALLLQRDEDGAQALFYACLSANAPLTKEMLARGADPSARNRRGNTPLSEATQTNCTECVVLLLGAGAAPDVHNDDHNGQMHGSTPLAEAVMLGFEAIAALLLGAGADPNALSSAGHSPLDWLACEGDKPFAPAMRARLARHGGAAGTGGAVNCTRLEEAGDEEEGGFAGKKSRAERECEGLLLRGVTRSSPEYKACHKKFTSPEEVACLDAHGSKDSPRYKDCVAAAEAAEVRQHEDEGEEEEVREEEEGGREL